MYNSVGARDINAWTQWTEWICTAQKMNTCIYSSVDDRGMNTGITQSVEGTCSRISVIIITVVTVG